jgi:hypothetical protein|tara:strand:+ start:4409 stop:5023 length:615 start_codon:yes stop_codon:yes gene_type:complete
VLVSFRISSFCSSSSSIIFVVRVSPSLRKVILFNDANIPLKFPLKVVDNNNNNTLKLATREGKRERENKREMSNNNEEDDLLYGDIVTSQGEDGRESLRVTRDRLEKSERHHAKRIEQLEAKVKQLETENERITKENIILMQNISSLYDTAKLELKRKDAMLHEERMKSINVVGGGTQRGGGGGGKNPPPPKPPPGGPPSGKKK